MLQSNLYSSFPRPAPSALCDFQPAETQTLWPKLHGLVHLVNLDQPSHIRWRSLGLRVMPEWDRQLICQSASQFDTQPVCSCVRLAVRQSVKRLAYVRHPVSYSGSQLMSQSVSGPTWLTVFQLAKSVSYNNRVVTQSLCLFICQSDCQSESKEILMNLQVMLHKCKPYQIEHKQGTVKQKE